MPDERFAEIAEAEPYYVCRIPEKSFYQSNGSSGTKA